jgi:hypothetical protein
MLEMILLMGVVFLSGIAAVVYGVLGAIIGWPIRVVPGEAWTGVAARVAHLACALLGLLIAWVVIKARHNLPG